MSDTQTITLRKAGQEQPVQVVGRMTPAGNMSFEYAGIRHILKPDGSVLQMVRYAYTRPGWERSPVLSVHQ
jgi:hypothetical protein